MDAADVVADGDSPNRAAFTRMQQMMEMAPKQRPKEFYNPLEKIEELLTCPICLDRYKSPKLLPCHHTFCADPCLEGLVDTLRRVVKCPECRAEHTLPYDGIKTFHTNYTLTGFLEIHLSATEENAAELESYIRRYNMERCKVCDEKAEVEYCPHCEKRVCLECKNTHMEMIKRDLARLLNQVKRLSNRVTEASDGLTKGIESLKLNCETTGDEVKDYMRRYVRELKKKEDHFIQEIDTFLTTETRLMRNLRDSLELESSNINEACARVDAFLKGETEEVSDEEVVRYKQLFTEGLDHLRAFHPDADDLFSKKVRFSVGQDANQLPAAILQFGELLICQPQFGGRFAQLEAAYVTRSFNLGLESDHYPMKRRCNFDPTDSSTWGPQPKEGTQGAINDNDAAAFGRRKGNLRKPEEETHTNIRYRRRAQLEEESWNRVRGGERRPNSSPTTSRRSPARTVDDAAAGTPPACSTSTAASTAHTTTNHNHTTAHAQVKNSPWSVKVPEAKAAIHSTAAPASSAAAKLGGDLPAKQEPTVAKAKLEPPKSRATAKSTNIANPVIPLKVETPATSEEPPQTIETSTKAVNESSVSSKITPPSSIPVAAAVPEAHSPKLPRQSSSTEDPLLNDKVDTIRRQHQMRQQELRAPQGGSLSGDGNSSSGSNKTDQQKYGAKCFLTNAQFKAPQSTVDSRDEESEEEEEEEDVSAEQPTAAAKAVAVPPVLQTQTSADQQSSSSGSSTPQRSIPVLHYSTPLRSSSRPSSAVPPPSSDSETDTTSVNTSLPQPTVVKTPPAAGKTSTTAPASSQLPVPKQSTPVSSPVAVRKPTNTPEQTIQGGKQMLKKAVPSFLRKQQSSSAKDSPSSSGDTSPASSTATLAAPPDWRKHLIPANPPPPKASTTTTAAEASASATSAYAKRPQQQRSNTIPAPAAADNGNDGGRKNELRPPRATERRRGSGDAVREAPAKTVATTEWTTEERRQRFVRSKTNPEIMSMSYSRVNELAAVVSDAADVYESAAAQTAKYKQRSKDSSVSRRRKAYERTGTDSTVDDNAAEPVTPTPTPTDRRARYRRKVERSSTVEPNDHQRFEISLGGAGAAANSEVQQGGGAPGTTNRFFRVFTQPKIDYLSKSKIITKWGKKGAKDSEFNWPRGVAVIAASDEIVVCDSSNHRSVVFNHKGQFKLSFGKYGNGKGEFDCLAGVTTNKFRQFVITDRYNHRVQIFDQSGRFVREFGTHGQTNGRFNNPWGCAVDNQNFIYVCDKDNHRVQIFQADGNFVGKFGAIGNKEGHFQNPHFIAVNNRQNQLLVTDSSNHRVQVFDHNGHFQFTFGTEGFQEGQFKYPRGIAVDDQGFIVVADSGNNRIQVFYPDGRFYCAFGGWGSGDGQLKGVEGVAITLDGHIVASDRENHRIQLF